MPIYKMEGKKDGKQKYRVRINYIDREGKSKQLDRVAYGKEEAKELERKLHNDLSEETVKKITLQQLYDEYIAVKQYEVRESSLEKCKNRLKNYILSDLKNYRIDKLTVAILQKWKISVEEKTVGKDKHKLSLMTKQNIFGEFRALLNYAVKMEYLQKNPLSSIGNFKDAYEGKHEMDFYTSDEFLKFIAAAQEHAELFQKTTSSIYEWNYYVFFYIAFYTGMRKGEINALKWTDIEDNTIHITRSITQKLKGGDRETPPKNKSSIRSIQIPAPLKKVIDEHLKRYKAISGFNNDWRICGGQECIRDSTIDKRNELYAENAGLKKIRIHDFRHSHASFLANNGINIQEIARRLGHSKVDITWNTYSHLYPKEEERAVTVLNSIEKPEKTKEIV